MELASCVIEAYRQFRADDKKRFGRLKLSYKDRENGGRCAKPNCSLIRRREAVGMSY